MRWRTAVVVVAVVLLTGAALAVVGRGLLGQYADSVQIGLNRAVFTGVHVRKGSDPLFDARRVEVDYDLRDLLPGSTHRFGLVAIAIDHPVFTLVRHADGSYNISGKAAPPRFTLPTPPPRVNGVPLAFSLHVTDGAIALRNPHALDPQSRSIDVRDIQVAANVDTGGRTHYRVTGAFAGARNEPFTVRGTVDAARGYAMHRIHAAQIPVRPIANFFINSKSAVVESGAARDLDLTIYGLDVQPDMPIDYHAGGHLAIDDASMRLVGLAQPLQHLSGELKLVDDQLFFSGLRAKIAQLSLRATGAVFDIPDNPQFHLGVTGSGNLDSLRSLFAFMKDQPIAGSNARIGVDVDGALGHSGPSVQATVDAPHVLFRGIPLDDLRATIAYSASTVFFMPIKVNVNGADVTLRGSLAITNEVHSRIALRIRAPADALPYFGSLIGSEPLVADFMLDGHDTNFYGYGAMQSTRGIGRMAAVVHADRGGILDVAPFWIDTERGQLAAGYSLDRVHDRSAYWIRARHLHLETPARAAFTAPGIPVMPPIDGTVDEADIAGGGPSGDRALLGGIVDAHDTTIAGVLLDRVHARFAGTLENAGIDPIEVRGPWGALDGMGALSLSTIAVRGHYHGTLEGLQQFMSGMPGRGVVDGTAALAMAGQRIVVQMEHLHLYDADIHGIPLQSASGTLAIDGGRLEIESARAEMAGGSIVAAGSYGSGGSGAPDAISLVATNLNGAQLHGMGLPLEAGRLDADGQLGEGVPLPTFDGGVALANGRVQQFAIDGSSLIALHGDGVHLARAVGGLDGIYTIAHGDLTTLTSSAPTYAIHADVPAGNLGTVISKLGIAPHYAEGTFDAALDVRGSGIDPRVRGPIGVTVGSINGLYYNDAQGLLVADRSGVLIHHGAVTVGSTYLRFGAAENPRMSGVHVRAAHTDLSDFNNFFDTGDTLDGNGSVAFNVISQGHRLASYGDLSIAGLRYRNLPIGDTIASWSSGHNVLRGSLNVFGAQGSLRSHGTIDLAPDTDLYMRLRNSSYNLTAQLSDLDLSTWVAALGYPQVPLTGRVDANASVQGRYPQLALQGNATIDDGTIWRLPIDNASATFSSSGRRIILDAFEFSAPGLAASATGNFGLRAYDPLALRVHAHSDDLPLLITQFTHKEYPFKGNVDTTVTVGGTFEHPTFDASLTATDATIYGVSVPSFFGSISLQGRSLVLHNAGAQLPKGTIALRGSLPIRLNPIAAPPGTTPVSFDLTAHGIDPSAFDALAGNDTKFGGAIDGELGITGTIAHPLIAGAFSVAKGTYVSNLDRIPITNLDAKMTFTGSSASVSELRANFGSGTVVGSGGFSFMNEPYFAIYANAHGAQFDLPAYGSGMVDANLALVRGATGDAKLSGKATLSNALIPFSAFIAAAQNSAQLGKTPLPPLDFDVDFVAGKNVRVRGNGYGAGLDIGATGQIHLAGSTTNPTLDGSFAATNGTLTYVDRAFRVQQAHVTFHPDDGVIPVLHASGITRISNPDPRSPYSSVDVTVSVDGQVTNPKISFSSSPGGYTDQQILAMIAPFGSVILSGTEYTTPGYQPAVPGAPASIAPVPGAQPIGGTANAQISAGQEAFDLVNAQFAAGLLNPIEGAISQGLGLQSVNLTLDYYGNVGLSASRVLGKTVNLLYAATFGIPQRTSFGLQFVGQRSTSAQLSFYFQNGPQRLFETPILTSGGYDARTVGLPLTGQNGFAFTFQRLFW